MNTAFLKSLVEQLLLAMSAIAVGHGFILPTEDPKFAVPTTTSKPAPGPSHGGGKPRLETVPAECNP